MWSPWNVLAGWGRTSNRTATENARIASVACSRARVERVEIEQYVAQLAERRRQRAIPA